MNTPLGLPFTDNDFETAEEIALQLGRRETAYSSTSDVIGLYCAKRFSADKQITIIKTAEIGWLAVSTLEDLNLFDLAARESKGEI